MASRYQEVYRLNQKLYLDGSPVIIEAGALQNDLVQNKILAQIKMRNISSKNIIACKVVIWAYEINGNKVEGISSFSYLDINVATGEYFGTKTPIYMPDNNTRQFSVVVIEVVFSDHSIWKSDLCEWFEIPAQPRIIDRYHDYEMARQYEIEVGGNCKAVPMLIGGLFLCTCGTENMQVAGTCYKCHRSYEDLFSKLDVSYLQEKLENRLRKEEEEREVAIAKKAAEEERRKKEEEERRQKAQIKVLEDAKRAKKRKNIILISLGIVCVIIIIILIPTYFIPESKYNKAIQSIENYDYDTAIMLLNELGNYKDSSSQLTDIPYKKAMRYVELGEYEKAMPILEELGHYKNCDEQLINVQYEQALKYTSEGNYVEAKELFETLGNYSDSAMQLAEIEYMQAIEEWNAGNTDTAIIIFEELGDYKDSEEKLLNIYYEMAGDSYNSGDYIEAARQYKLLEYFDYKDSREQYEKTIIPMIQQASIGDIVIFNDYEWKVLAKENGKTLLLAVNSIGVHQFDSNNKSSTWADCSLRTWLNSTFYNGFSDYEKLHIVNTKLTNNEGKKTEDKVFILSPDEIKTYLPTINERKLGYRCWLRSTTTDRWGYTSVMFVDLNGIITDCSYGFELYVDSKIDVLPAIWIDIE